MVEPKSLHGAGPEIVGDYVRRFHQLEEDFLAPGMGNVHAEAALVAGAVVDQVARLVPPFFTGLAVGKGPRLAVLQVVRALDANHISPQIGQETRSPGQGVHLFQGQDSDTVQNSLLCHALCTSVSAQ